MHIDLYIALAGLIVGFAVGLTGMGGGALMTPILVLVFGVQPLAAVSSDLVASLLMKPLGALVHVTHRTVRWGLVRWLSLGSVPGALLGVTLPEAPRQGDDGAERRADRARLGAAPLGAPRSPSSGCTTGRVAAPCASRPPMTSRSRSSASPPPLWGSPSGSSWASPRPGPGTLIIVSLLLIYPRLRGSQTVGTDLTQAIPMVGAAALGHVLFGDFKLALTLSIVMGAIPGVLAGSLVSSRSSTGPIRAALCVVLMVSGLKLIGVPTAAIGVVLAVALVSGAVAFVIRRHRDPHRPADRRACRGLLSRRPAGPAYDLRQMWRRSVRPGPAGLPCQRPFRILVGCGCQPAQFGTPRRETWLSP